MKTLWISLLAGVSVVAAAPTLADDVADQRARLANQRIQIEEERRASEEAERLRLEAAERAESTVADERGSEATTQDSEEVAASDVSAARMEMSRALEQLRELGALRDAGYVTEEEFERLKKKILDAAL